MLLGYQENGDKTGLFYKLTPDKNLKVYWVLVVNGQKSGWPFSFIMSGIEKKIAGYWGGYFQVVSEIIRVYL